MYCGIINSNTKLHPVGYCYQLDINNLHLHCHFNVCLLPYLLQLRLPSDLFPSYFLFTISMLSLNVCYMPRPSHKSVSCYPNNCCCSVCHLLYDRSIGCFTVIYRMFCTEIFLILLPISRNAAVQGSFLFFSFLFFSFLSFSFLF